MAGLIHLFDLIVTAQDLPATSSQEAFPSSYSRLYQHTMTRLKLDSSVCLIFEDLSTEQQFSLSKFHFFSLKLIPESVYQLINHNQPLVVQRKNGIDWKWIGIWIGLPLLFCLLWFWIFQLFKSLIIPPLGIFKK
jgi:hypothetical protein